MVELVELVGVKCKLHHPSHMYAYAYVPEFHAKCTESDDFITKQCNIATKEGMVCIQIQVMRGGSTYYVLCTCTAHDHMQYVFILTHSML